MHVIFLLAVAVFIFAFAGWGLCRLCLSDPDRGPAGTIMVFGYAFIVSLYFPLYFILQDPQTPVYAVLLLALLINGYTVLKLRNTTLHSVFRFSELIKHRVAYALFIGVVLVSAIPYISAGVGNYWHSANEDIFDGLDGRNAYLNRDLISNSAVDVSTRVGSALSEGLLSQTGVTQHKDSEFFKDRYVKDLGRLQYSSLATLSVLLNLPKGMDIFLIQALLNLGMFALGVYAFGRHVLQQRMSIAALTALISSLGNFYLTTYVNGHEGSLIYNAVIPFILFFAVMAIKDRWPLGRWLVVPGVLLAMVLLAYPYPLPYVIAPVLGFAMICWLLRWLGASRATVVLIDRRNQIAFLLLIIVGFAVVYWLAEPIRLRAMSQFRSWGTVLNHVGFLQFWGLWPSQVVNSNTTLPWLNSHEELRSVSLISAVMLSSATIYGFYRLAKQGHIFTTVWAGFWILFFFVMRFAIYDSYYVYKFLYLNAWLIFSAAMVTIGYLIENKRAAYKVAGVSILSIWFIPNIINNSSAFMEIKSSSFNRNSANYRRITEVPKIILENTYISIPITAHDKLVRRILSDEGIHIKRNIGEASYLLKQRGLLDITPEPVGDIVWESEIFSIIKRPINDNIEIATYWQPEGGLQVFRWVSDARIGKVLIDIKSRAANSNYIYICGAAGPSVDHKPLSITVTDVNKKAVSSFIMSTQACHWLNISQYTAPFSIEHAEEGKIISYIDNRKLVYRLFHIGLSSTPSVHELPQEHLLAEDIVSDQSSNNSGILLLGQNWFPFEKFNGESFRWVNNGALLKLKNVNTSGALAIDVELGPSAGHPIVIQIRDRSGKNLGSCQVDRRKLCIIPIKFEEIIENHLEIVSNAASLPIKTDPRILNFRVFKIGWTEQ